MNNLTILGSNLIWENDRIDLFKDYGTRCAVSDFAILLGAYVSELYYTYENNTSEDRCGYWYTKTKAPYENCDAVFIITHDGFKVPREQEQAYGVRPATVLSDDLKINLRTYLLNKMKPYVDRPWLNVIYDFWEDREALIYEFDYGYYPQMVEEEGYSLLLEEAYNNGALISSGNYYTSRDFNKDVSKNYTEYVYNDNYYIRVVADEKSEGKKLSDGREIKSGDVYWIKVEPIAWLLDYKTKIAVTKKIMFAGVKFFMGKSYDGNFDATYLNWFLNNCFLKEIKQDRYLKEDKLVRSKK